MSLTQQLVNQAIELREKYNIVLKTNDSRKIKSANRVILALYSITNGCILSTINRVSGDERTIIKIQAKQFSELAHDQDMSRVCELIENNIKQILGIVELSSSHKTILGKFGVELSNAIDQGTEKIYKISKISHGSNK